MERGRGKITSEFRTFTDRHFGADVVGAASWNEVRGKITSEFQTFTDRRRQGDFARVEVTATQMAND
jgi:hypothetical protein